jgi:hypothetical protein
LAHLCVKAGERSGQRLYASLPADGEEYQIFRHVGFTAYAQEDVYKLMSPPSGLEGVEPLPVRRQHLRDSWGLQQLYATVTPRAVQNAEGSAQPQWELGHSRWWRSYPHRKGYVWESQDEIWAALQIRASTSRCIGSGRPSGSGRAIACASRARSKGILRRTYLRSRHPLCIDRMGLPI